MHTVEKTKHDSSHPWHVRYTANSGWTTIVGSFPSAESAVAYAQQQNENDRSLLKKLEGE